MELSKIIIEYSDLKKITPNVIYKLASNKFNIDIDFNKTWEENGLDDLDVVELIMTIEKELNIIINDDIAEFLFNSKPSIFADIISEQRVDKINRLGI